MSETRAMAAATRRNALLTGIVIVPLAICAAVSAGVALYADPLSAGAAFSANAAGPAAVAAAAKTVYERHVYSQVHMGTQVRIVLYADSEVAARYAAAAGFAEIARLDAVLSDYRRDSELNRLADSAGKGPVEVSNDLFLVLERALDLGRQTKGAFDITAGPLTRLWRRAHQTERLPAPEELAAARYLTGLRKIRLVEEPRAVELLLPGMQLDLGAIGKGYALDRALVEVRRAGSDRALLEAGGDIVVGDAPPDRDGWKIVVPQAANHCTIELAEAAISTSGDTEQFVEIHGRRYSHVLDPRTGLGLTHRAMATVIAPEGVTADPLATALTVLDETEGRALLAAHPEARAFVRRVAPGSGFSTGLVCGARFGY